MNHKSLRVIQSLKESYISVTNCMFKFQRKKSKPYYEELINKNDAL